MNTVFINLFNKQALIAIGISITIFASSVVSAHAAAAESLAKMESQLNTASVIVSSLLAKITPQGEVKGITTSTTAQELLKQITDLRNQVNLQRGTSNSSTPSGGDSATAVDASAPSKDKNVIALQAQLKALMLQRDNLNKKVAEIDAQIVVLKDKIQKITNPVPLKPTPRFNGFSAPGTPLVTVSAVFGAPKVQRGSTGPIVLGKVNWGDAGDSESVSALVTGAQMFVDLKHTYKAPGTYTITLTDLNGKTATQKVFINQVIEESTGPVFESLGNEAVVIKNSESTVTDDAGRFTAKFELTANDTDVHVPAVVIDGGIVGSPLNWGVSYSISMGDGKESRPGTRTATLSSTADKSGNFFVINEGETESFTLSALFDPTAAGMYQLQLGALNWAPTASAVGIKQVQFKPEASFATNKIQISN